MGPFALSLTRAAAPFSVSSFKAALPCFTVHPPQGSVSGHLLETPLFLGFTGASGFSVQST